MAKDQKKLNSFDWKIREISSSKELVIAEREEIKKKLVEAIKQDQDSTELYEAYRTKSEEIDWYDDKIKSLKSKRAEVRIMPIYSKTPEWQDEILAWDEVYEFLKKWEDKELLEALRERKMTVDQYMTLLYGDPGDKTVDRIGEMLKSISLEIKVWKSWKWIKTLNDQWFFNTKIGEEYILNRLSHYFPKNSIKQEDLKKIIEFPEGVNILKPEDTEIKFKCGDIEWVIKVKFIMQDSNNENEGNESDESGNEGNRGEGRESSEERELSSKELYDSLESYIKDLVWDDLASAKKEDIEEVLDLLEIEKHYKEFCKMSKGENVLNDEKVKFPSNFKDFVKKIAPIDLDEEQLVAILQSNYKKLGKKWWVVVFWPRSFRNRGYAEWPELKNLYGEREGRERFNIVADGDFLMNIHQIEREIINKYYPHLKEVYFKDKATRF